MLTVHRAKGCQERQRAQDRAPKKLTKVRKWETRKQGAVKKVDRELREILHYFFAGGLCEPLDTCNFRRVSALIVSSPQDSSHWTLDGVPLKPPWSRTRLKSRKLCPSDMLKAQGEGKRQIKSFWLHLDSHHKNTGKMTSNCTLCLQGTTAQSGLPGQSPL